METQRGLSCRTASFCCPKKPGFSELNPLDVGWLSEQHVKDAGGLAWCVESLEYGPRMSVHPRMPDVCGP